MNNIIPPQQDSQLILVVEDEEFIRLQLRQMMEQAGYQVAEAGDGEQALATYSRLKPDIVLLDALMPKMDGFTCCAQIQELSNTLRDRPPILMITALADQESVERAFAAGATDFITKPIHSAVLRHRVQRLIQSSQAMKELRHQTELAQLREEQLRLALDAAQIGTWNWDILNGKVTYSPQTAINFGFTPGTDSTYDSFLKSIHPEDREFVTQAVHYALEKKADYNIQFRVIQSDNSVHWIESKGQVYYETGTVRMIGVSTNITTRKQAEEALQQSEEFLQRIIKSSPDCIKILDLEGRLLYMSAGGQALLEIDDFSSFRNSKWVDFWQEIYNHPARSAVETAKAGGIGKFQGYCPTAKGTPKWWEVVVTPLLDAEGKPEKLLSVSRDITERKQAEKALQESNQQIINIFESITDAFLTLDQQWRVTYLNSQAAHLLQKKREELLGKNLWDELPQTASSSFFKQYQQAVSQRTSIGFEEFYAPLNSWFEVRAYPSPDGLSVYFRDITARKQVELELQRQNLRSQLFADVTLKIRQSLEIDEILQATVAEVQKLLQADRALIFRLWSNGVGHIVTEAVVPEYPSVVGQNITDECFGSEYLKKYIQGRIYTISDVDKAGVQPCLVQFMRQFSVKAKLVMPILLKEELWGLLIVHQCSSPRQWTSFEVELLRQLADQIGIALAQAQILEVETRRREELNRSNVELQEFASIASHDLQEPLRKIQTFGNRLKTISSETLTDQGLDYLERMQNAAERMQSLIDDLLILSRITTRARPFVAVNLVQVTREVLSDLEVLIQQTRGRVEMGELPYIEADPVQMRQLLQNLIGNALKFHKDQAPPIIKIYGKLLVGDHPAKNAVGVELCQILVEDNGIGFDEKYLDRIFNVFQRLHSRSEYPGTGMGLAICRKIAERHGGSITAVSTPGEGATFIVTLPIKQQKGDAE